MQKRKIFLIFVSMFSIIILVGCSNKRDNGYSGGYPSQNNTEYTKVILEKNESATSKENKNSTSIFTDVTTTVVISKDSNANSTVTVAPNDVQTVVPTVAPTVAPTMEPTMASTMATAKVTNATTEPITTENVEPSTQAVYAIPDDTISIRNSIIPLVYGFAEQDLVDNNEVVYDTGLVTGINTFLIGHNFKSFSILDSVSVGEKIAMNNHGELKFYEVQRSERAYLNSTGTDAFFCSDNSEILVNNYGYNALILYTCDKQDEVNHRWIVIAKEVMNVA